MFFQSSRRTSASGFFDRSPSSLSSSNSGDSSTLSRMKMPPPTNTADRRNGPPPAPQPASETRSPPRPLVPQRHADQDREVRQQQPHRETGLGDARVQPLL